VGASVKGSPAGAALSGTSFENQNANRDSKRSAPPQQAAVQWREAATTEGRAMRRAAAGASKCSACGEPMRVKRAGRKRDFCGSKCRQAAYRDRAPFAANSERRATTLAARYGTRRKTQQPQYLSTPKIGVEGRPSERATGRSI
jgi:hypothetical protein